MEERRVRTTFILELNFLLRKKSVSLYTTVLEVGVGRIAIVCVVRPNLLCSSIELSCLDGFDQNNFRYSFIFSNFEYWSSDQSSGSVSMSYSHWDRPS